MIEFKVFWVEFKKFISKGSIIDLAVGVVIGAAFGKIVSSLVGDIIMPIVSMLLGKVSFSNLFIALDFVVYETLADAQKAGAPVLLYGKFIQSIIDFVIIGWSVFVFVKVTNRAKKFVGEEIKTTKECEECYQEIKIKAKVCPFCHTRQNL